MLYFITSNKNKIEIAKKFLKPHQIDFEAKDLDITEVQSENIETVATTKAKDAFLKIGKPLIISDHFWSIPALGGFPGAFMKYINLWLTSKDLLRLMKDIKNRKIFLTEMICYIDSKTIKTFSYVHEGKILNQEEGIGLAATKIISLTKDNKSIAQKLIDGPSAIEKGIVWDKFANWFKKYN